MTFHDSFDRGVLILLAFGIEPFEFEHSLNYCVCTVLDLRLDA
jgi:hypothetical protein